MKTAREIIAAATYESWANYPACTHSLPWEQEAEKLPGKAASFRKHADAILAALAAEGFSIVETGRDPVTIEACAKVADCGCDNSFCERDEIASSIRSLSRPTETE